MGSIRQLICAIRGHDDYLHFAKNRVYLECVACGHESPGWTIEPRRPALRLQSRPLKTSGGELIRKIA
jgi:hypothetical protein